MAPTAKPDDTERAIAACLTNADELLRTAKGAIERDGLPRIGFHLAALALEEVGKAHLLRMVRRGRLDGEEPPAVMVRALEDRGHVKRLFWAIWSGTFGHEVVSGQQIRELQGMAKEIHETRLKGLYVDFDAGELSLPSNAVSPEQSMNLFQMADSRLRYEQGFSATPRRLTADEMELQAWFLAAGEDPERMKLVFSSESMTKLAEVGQPGKWMRWLKETWEKHESDSRAFIEKQLRPEVTEAATDGKADKWKLRVRLFTSSHSIRQKPLNKWNDGVAWIKLHAAEKKNQLLVDFIAPKRVPLDGLYWSAWGIARRFATALNIGSMGFFWWYLPEHVDRYYESLTDLEANREIQMLRSPRLAVDWKGSVLDDGALTRTMFAMSALPGIENTKEHPPFDRYLEGTTWLSKNDVHMEFHAHAFGCFYEALQKGIELFEEPDTTRTPAERVGGMMKTLVPAFDEMDKYLYAGEAFVSRRALTLSLTLSEAAAMKIFCDAYFNRVFSHRMKQRDAKDGDEV
jgi:AbiV family abortive infection protein